MDKRHLIVYLFACACIYFGVSFMVDGNSDPAPDEARTTGGVREIDPAAVLDGGQIGEGVGGGATAGAQITLVEAPEWPSDQQPPPRPVVEVDSDREYEGESRSEALQETLRNLQGMDVYVEGVDGPVPNKTRHGR